MKSFLDKGKAMIDPATLNILSNLATDLIKYGSSRFLNNTLAGTKLREKIGKLDSTSEDEFKKVLFETYVTYFSKYPDRQFQVFYIFFASEDVVECLHDFVFNFVTIDYLKLENVLKMEMGNDWILFRILKKQNLTITKILTDFTDCYQEREKASSGIGFLTINRAINRTEARIISAIKEPIENSERRYQELLDAFKKKSSKSTSQSTKKTTITPVSPYSLLPFAKQEEKLIQDLSEIVAEKHGAITPDPIFSDQFHITIPIRSDKYVLKLLVVRKCTLKGEVWGHIRRIWNYEHGVLLIAMESVVEKAFPSAFTASAMPQHSLTEWGWFTIFNLLYTRYMIQGIATPKNTVESSFFCFTLPKIKNREILKNRFNALLGFLETDDDNYARIQSARSSINSNLAKWLDEGWSMPTDNRAYVGFKRPPRKLKKNEKFTGGEIRSFEHIKVFEDNFKQILKLQKQK